MHTGGLMGRFAGKNWLFGAGQRDASPTPAESWHAEAHRAILVRHSGLILLALVALGGVLRFYGIASTWVALDEKATMELCQAPWATFWHAMWVREMNMVGYYALVRLWLLVGWELAYKVTFVRGLSVLLSLATIPVLYGLGKKLFNEHVGILAAGLLSINAYHIKYAQTARSYSLFIFLVSLATSLLVRNIKNESPKWNAYVCVWVLAVYTHVFAFWFLAAHLILMFYIGLWPKGRHFAGLIVGIIPMALWTATHRDLPLKWVPPTTIGTVAELFVVLVGDYGFLLLLVVAIALLPAFRDFATLAKEQRLSLDLLLVWAFAPVVLTILASLIQPCFFPRYLIACLPATTLLTAAGIDKYKTLPALLLTALIVFGMLLGRLMDYGMIGA
jgi:mannosyltransferase